MTLTLKQIDANIKAIRQSKLHEKIHATGVAILEHGAVHGDISRAGDLVGAIHVKVVRQALIAWFKAYSPVTVNPDTFQAKQTRSNSPSFKPYDVEGAKANPYYVMSTQDTVRFMGAADVFGPMYAKLKLMEEAHKQGRYVGDFSADRAALLRAIQASKVTDMDALREQTKNLKDAALAAAKREQAQVAIAQAKTLKEELAA